MYTYQQLLEDVDFLSFQGLETGILGKSEAGYNIPYIHCGNINAAKQIIITGGIHARENVSAIMVARQAFLFAKKAHTLSGGIYFVPMINVDGALLIENGADFFENRREFLLKTNGGSNDFSLWKANINAVDLNTNFDAGFSTGVNNKNCPSPSDYTGKAPFDQSETLALSEFTQKIKPGLTVSYHALGQEIYWFFGQTDNYERDNRIAAEASKALSYKKIEGCLGSAGGYKDWCVQKLKIPSLTIEIGRDGLSHPLSEEDISEDWETNKCLPRLLLGLA